MIPRYQRILFWSLAGGILLMSAFLLHGCQAAHKRRAAFNDSTPIAAPVTTSTEDVTFYLANDADASITPGTRQLALPRDPTLRARTLLEQLLSGYAQPTSAHPLAAGPSVDDVFLLTPPPLSKPGTHAAENAPGGSEDERGQLAVVNLHGAFVEGHPSGVEVEALTIASIIGTLHAALPQITQVRFLVDGQPRETLAGHADLLRTYAAEDTTTKATPLIDNSEGTQR